MSNYNNFLWIVLFILLYSNNARRTENVTELKNMFKETIEAKLSDPNVSPDDICKLAQAYSELTKNDWMKDMTKNMPVFGNSVIPSIEESK